MDAWEARRAELCQTQGTSRRHQRATGHLALSTSSDATVDDADDANGDGDDEDNGSQQMRRDRNGIPLARVWRDFDPETYPVRTACSDLICGK